MKKSYLIVAMLLLIGTFIVSCSKSGEKINEAEEQNELASDQQKAEPQVEHSYNYNCNGECTNGTECTMTIYIQGGYVECNCEGCILTVTIDKDGETKSENNQGESLKKLHEKELFFKELSSLIERKHNTEKFSLLSIELTEYGNDYYLLYDYLADNKFVGSVMYAVVNPDNEKDQQQKYEIDCAGSCDDAQETCRERFNFNPPSAECTCEGDDCKMTVTEI